MTQAQVCRRLAWSAGRSTRESHPEAEGPPRPGAGTRHHQTMSSASDPQIRACQAVTHAVRVFSHVTPHNDQILDFGRWDLVGVGQRDGPYPDPTIYREAALGVSERRDQRRTSRKETP
jgi:hypothetical protein